MLYIDTLRKFTPYVESAIDALFDTAYANQSHSNDLLILIENGFHKELGSFEGVRMSPYTIGPGDEGWDEQTQFEFYDNYRQHNMADRVTTFKEVEKEKTEMIVRMSIHLELMIYLKFWESNRLVKILYILSRLSRGDAYDWMFRADKFKIGKAKKGRSYILEQEVRDGTAMSCLPFSMLMQDCYSDQIRNAVAHSQFSMSQSHIGFSNYEPGQTFHQLKSIPIEKWEEYACSVIIMYNTIIKNLNKYHKLYAELATGLEEGLPLRIIKEDGAIELRGYVYDEVNNRWSWLRFK